MIGVHNRKQQKFSRFIGIMTNYSLISHICRPKKGGGHQQWDKIKAGQAQEVQDPARKWWATLLLNTSPVKRCRANGDQRIHPTAEILSLEFFPLWSNQVYSLPQIWNLNQESEKSLSFWAFWGDLSPECLPKRRCENGFKSWLM